MKFWPRWMLTKTTTTNAPNLFLSAYLVDCWDAKLIFNTMELMTHMLPRKLTIYTTIALERQRNTHEILFAKWI